MSLSVRCMWTDNEFLCGRKTLQYLCLKLYAPPYKVQLSGRPGVHLWALDISHTWYLWDRSTSFIYRVIHKSLREFRPLRCSSLDCHAEGEHVNRGRDTPTFCLTLQVLHISTLGNAADVNPVIKFLPHTYVALATYVAGTWLQDWQLPRHRGWTYRAPVS